jgi:hypothetical protein
MCRNRIEIAVNGRLDCKRAPLAVEQGEIERQVKARAIVPVEMAYAIDLALHLACQYAIGKFIDHGAQLLEAAHAFGTVIGEPAGQPLRGRRSLRIEFGIGRIVAKELVLNENGTRIDTEAVNTAR